MTIISYVIRPGDTLTAIAQRFGTTILNIARLNGITDSNIIYAGQTIRIPSEIGTIPPDGMPDNNVTPLPDDSQLPMPMLYTVQYGDTLSSIAQQFNTTVSRLVELNGINAAFCLCPGTVIRTN